MFTHHDIAMLILCLSIYLISVFVGIPILEWLKDKKWKSIKNNLPPGQTVLIKDKNGNIGYAVPTYYHFTANKNHNGLYDASDRWLFHDPRWDGNWIVEANDDLLSPIDSDITHFKIIQNDTGTKMQRTN